MVSLAPYLAFVLTGVGSIDTIRTARRLDEFLARAKVASPALDAARARHTASAERVTVARQPDDPMVELGSMNRSLPGLGRKSPVAMDQLRLVQPVPLSGRRHQAGLVARARADADASAVEEADRRLRWQVTETAVEIDRLDRVARLLRSYRPALEQLQEVSRVRYGAGLATQAEVIRAQVETARLSEEEIMARTERRGMVARLNGLTLEPPATTVNSVVLPTLPDSLPPLADLVSQALRDHPTLHSRRAIREAYSRERQRIDAERWPDLEVGLGLGQQPMPDGAGTERMLSLTLGGRIPLWSRTARRAMGREATAMARMADAEVAMAEAEMTARIGELVAAFDRAGELRRLALATLGPQTRAAATAALTGYRNGSVDFEAAGSAHLEVIRVELDLVRLEGERARVLAELEYLTGFGFGGYAEGASR